MNGIILDKQDIPSALRAWLDDQDTTRLLVELVQLDDGSLALRELPGVDAGLVERAQVTIAKYREALMNLT